MSACREDGLDCNSNQEVQLAALTVGQQAQTEAREWEAASKREG